MLLFKHIECTKTPEKQIAIPHIELKKIRHSQCADVAMFQVMFLVPCGNAYGRPLLEMCSQHKTLQNTLFINFFYYLSLIIKALIISDVLTNTFFYWIFYSLPVILLWNTISMLGFKQREKNNTVLIWLYIFSVECAHGYFGQISWTRFKKRSTETWLKGFT